MSKVRYIFSREKMSWVPSDHYRLRDDIQWKWVRRLYQKILESIAKPVPLKDVIYETVELDTANIIEQILKQRSDLYMTMNREATKILIGKPQFFELVTTLQSQIPYMVLEKTNTGNPIFDGLQVEIIPWMDGVIVY